MRRKIKASNRVIIPALVDSFGVDRSGRVVEVKPFFGRTLVTVHFDHPEPNGRMVIILYEHQIIKISAFAKQQMQIPKSEK